MKPLLIITAMHQEAKLLEHALQKSSRIKTHAFDYLEGMIGSNSVVICVGGVGKANAAIAATALIERLQPKLVINCGCAGACPGSGLSIGDLAVASDEIFADEGVITSVGWKDLYFMDIPSHKAGKHRYHNEIPLSKHAAERAMRLAGYLGVTLSRGRFLTVSTCSGTVERGWELTERFHGLCENMEGAAVALACLRYDIDCLEIRGVSNLIEERDMTHWDIPRAVEASQRFVIKYIEDMDRPVAIPGTTGRAGDVTPEQ